MRIGIGIGIDSVVGGWKPNFDFTPVVEDRARVDNRTYSFTGTARTVGSGKTYATITAAYAAASSGDIIEVYDSLDMNSETSGYLLLANATKNILIRGMGATPSDVVLSQTGASTFCVRIETGATIVFENIKITRDNNTSLVYVGSGYSAVNIFNNCYLHNAKVGGNNYCYILGGASREALTKWVEFKNCTLKNTDSSVAPVNIIDNGANTQYLFTNCTFNQKTGSVFALRGGNTAMVAIYDSILTNESSSYVMQIGEETTTPAQTIGQIDIRTSTFNYTGVSVGHTFLIGRGTRNVYVVNNQITCPAINNATAGGITLKTQAQALTEAIVKGNRIVAPRTFVLNQCKYCDVRDNVIINNESNWEALLIINGINAGEYTQNNNVSNNTIYALNKLIRLDTNSVAETAKDSAKTGTINSNKYSTNTGKYLYNDGTLVEWADKATFWGNTFDANSKYKANVASPV